MRHVMLLTTIALTALAATGCAKKSSETAETYSRDSLIASSPVEPPSGDLTPSTPWEPQPQEPAHRVSPRPKSAATPHPAPQSSEPQAEPAGGGAKAAQAPGLNVEWGSFISVTFDADISSETAHTGDSWSGTLKRPVYVRDRVAFAEGSVVHGTVKDTKPAQAGDRALLALEMTSIEANGQSWPVSATADPIVAGSPRARNVGAVAGGAAAGALIGRAVGGNKGGVIGGLLGGAAAGGAVAQSKGYQAVVKSGSTLTFTVARDVVVRP